MTIRKRYTVVLQADALRALEELVVEDLAVTQDVETFERDLSFSPHSAGILKSSGYFIGRRGAVEFKYSVSDEDRLVRIIGVRRCSHPLDVVLSPEVRAWLSTNDGTVEGNQAMEAMKILIPKLRRDPRLIGHRQVNGQYRAAEGQVILTFEIDEANSRVTMTAIESHT